MDWDIGLRKQNYGEVEETSLIVVFKHSTEIGRMKSTKLRPQLYFLHDRQIVIENTEHSIQSNRS